MSKLGLVLLIMFNVSYADTNKLNESDSKEQAKAVMDGVYGFFLKVIPYVYSDESYVIDLKKDKKKREELINNLNDLSSFFKSAKHVEYLQRPGFRPTLESMNSHLTDTINSIKSENYVFAQKRLSALTSLCISCHSQLSNVAAHNAFGDALQKAKREDFPSDFTYGNYLYLIRNFESAERYLLLALDKAIAESRSQELYPSLRRVISLYTKIDFNYDKADIFLSKYEKNMQLPVLAKNTISSWHSSLKSWKNFKRDQIPSIDEFIQKYLSPLEQVKELVGSGDNDITLLISSGVLSKYLNDHPDSQSTPQILYWLSVAEKRLSNTYFFTLSDLYLKSCIKLYSKSPYAKKCYNLYEENIMFGYTGSGGIDIPPEEKIELKQLRSFLK